MLVSEIMSTCVARCTEDTKLEEVFELIRKCDHGLVIVVDSHVHPVPIGVVSERSICEQIITRGRNPKSLAAGSVMDSRIRTVPDSALLDDIHIDSGSDLAAVVVTDDKRNVRGLLPKNKIPTKRTVEPAQPVYVPQVAARRSPAVSEIPAFGWLS